MYLALLQTGRQANRADLLYKTRWHLAISNLWQSEVVTGTQRKRCWRSSSRLVPPPVVRKLRVLLRCNLKKHLRVTLGDLQQLFRCTRRLAASLFPLLQGTLGHPKGGGKLRL